jgi:hypothetical protein
VLTDQRMVISPLQNSLVKLDDVANQRCVSKSAAVGRSVGSQRNMTRSKSTKFSAASTASNSPSPRVVRWSVQGYESVSESEPVLESEPVSESESVPESESVSEYVFKRSNTWCHCVSGSTIKVPGQVHVNDAIASYKKNHTVRIFKRFLIPVRLPPLW